MNRKIGASMFAFNWIFLQNEENCQRSLSVTVERIKCRMDECFKRFQLSC